MKKNKGKKKLGLTTVIFIALIAGAVTGTIINNFFMHIDVVNKVIVEGIFYVIGQGFISLMKMLVVPLVFFFFFCGAASIGDLLYLYNDACCSGCFECRFFDQSWFRFGYECCGKCENDH